MAKTIEFDYKDKHYVLEYNRASIMTMEQKGFRFDQAETKVITTMSALFEGAFYMHHKNIKLELINEIFDSISDKTKLFEKLGEMLADTVKTLQDDGGQGNLKWEANW